MSRINALLAALALWLVLAAPALAAVSGSNLDKGVGDGSPGTLTSQSTNSVAIPANNLILVSVISNVNSGTPVDPTLSGDSITWVEITTVTSGTARSTVFRGMSSSSQSGVLTIAWGTGVNHVSWSVDKFSGVVTTGSSGSGAVVQSVTGTGTSALPSVTLAALQSGSASFGAVGGFNAGTYTVSPGSGYTTLGDTAPLGHDASVSTEYESAGSTTVNWSLSTADLYGFAAVAVEIAAGPSTTLSHSILMGSPF